MGQAEVGASEPPAGEADEPAAAEAGETAPATGYQIPGTPDGEVGGIDQVDVPETPPVPEPEPEPGPEPGVGVVLARLDELRAAVGQVDARIAERDRLAARDRDLLDRLHAENQRLRAGEAFAVIAPVARDLVRLRDQLLQLDAASPTPGTSDAALIEPQLLGILARLGIEPYGPAEGDTFDAARHQGVGRTKTGDPDLDGRVAAVRREGFTAPEGRLLRAAEVEVWQHVPTEPEPSGGS